MTVWIDPLRAAIFGLDTRAIADSLHAQMRGLRATKFYDRQEEVETVARIHPDERETISQLKNLLIHSPLGFHLPLKQVASLRGGLSPSEIWHRNKARMIQISGNLGSTSLESAAQSVKKAIKKISFPQEYYADIGGQYEDMVQANRDFWKAMILTLFLVFMVMACQFESLSQPLVMMGTVALSVIGSTAALVLAKVTITMGVFVGLLMLGGIVVNNGIMLIERLTHLRKEHPDKSDTQLLIQAGQERMRPIFMTSTTTLLGLLPDDHKTWWHADPASEHADCQQ